MEVVHILQADLWGYALYTEWRQEQKARQIMADHIDDEEMERLCKKDTEWPWDRVVGNG